MKPFLVEGYTDVISLYQGRNKKCSGFFRYILNTRPSEAYQKRFSPNITLTLYDGDKAGIKAAIRGVDILLRTRHKC